MFKNELKFLEKFKTIAIAPHYEEGHTSKIYAHQGTLDSKFTVSDIMDQYCMFHGADLFGRIKAARKMLRVRKSPPIMISEPQEIMAMQVPLAHYKEPMWIFDLEFDIHPIGSKHCEIHFRTNDRFEIPLSEEAIEARKTKLFLLHFMYKYPLHRKRLLG